MTYLFGPRGKKALQSLKGKGVILAFDYDGTLAPIASRPYQARIPEHTARQLRELTGIATVAVISGRARADLNRLLPFRPRFVVGNHGLEGAGQKRQITAARRTCRAWRKQLKLAVRGLELEDKRYTLSLHYRNSPDRRRAKIAILRGCRTLDPAPRIILGKCVVNLVPPGSPNKGTALEALLTLCKARRALYVGDDHTDEDVFRLRDRRVLSVRVNRRANSRAPYYLRNQVEIDRLLTALLHSAS